VRVKRDGPRGWHWISAAHFDPAKHELMDAPAAAAPAQQDRPRRGRPRVVVAVGEPLVAREKEPTSSFNDRIEASVRALYAEHRPRIDA
jgi:hypothetical protein